MLLPVKITPDRIRDSVVQVFFNADIPFEPLIGFCYTALGKSGWKYSNRQPPLEPQSGLIIEFAPVVQHFFIKDHVRFQLFANQSIAFNCINRYIGWKDYGGHIRNVINELAATGHFTQFTRIGIRYISEFANIDILEKIKYKPSLLPVAGKVSSSTFRFVYTENEVAKNVQIDSKIPLNPVLGTVNEPVNFISLLDVDIVQQGLSIKEADSLWREIDRLHTIEKETFFSLLDDEFLQSLNPEYS